MAPSKSVTVAEAAALARRHQAPSEKATHADYDGHVRLHINPILKDVKLGELGRARDRKVLIIDDNPHARAVLSSMLTSLTFIADEAASGEEAINMVRQATGAGAPYEIVFIDWQMPGLNGIETGRRILSMSDSKVPPHLVMVTAYGREEVMKQAEENGFDNVLIKPVTSSVLFDDGQSHQGHRAPALPSHQRIWPRQ